MYALILLAIPRGETVHYVDWMEINHVVNKDNGNSVLTQVIFFKYDRHTKSVQVAAWRLHREDKPFFDGKYWVYPMETCIIRSKVLFHTKTVKDRERLERKYWPAEWRAGKHWK